jgi:hypothetical protein
MPRTTRDLGPLRPLRKAPSERSPAGRVTVVEIQRRGWFARFIAWGLPPAHNHVALDETGSLIWELCDGAHDVHAIADTLAARFGPDFDPTSQRLAVFLQTMEARGWIHLGAEERPACGDEEPCARGERPGDAPGSQPRGE